MSPTANTIESSVNIAKQRSNIIVGFSHLVVGSSVSVSKLLLGPDVVLR